MFSKACEYAIRSTIYVAEQAMRNERASLKAIAKEIESPVAFTAKIMQQLARNNIVYSIMGPTGGFQMDKDRVDEIKLSEVVNAIDGDAIYRGCGLGLKECDASRPCPLHDKFAVIRNDLKEMLENTSIYELTTGLEIGLTFLRR
ncbi:MAG: Rrf2 family transcriptional regulator [Cyclobacteriaceae bacterium]